MAFGLFISHHYASCTNPLRSSLRFSASRACQSALIKQFVTEAGAEGFFIEALSLLHSLKACRPICVTEVGFSTVVRR